MSERPAVACSHTPVSTLKEGGGNMRKPLEAIDRSVAESTAVLRRARWVAPCWRTEIHTWLIHKVEPAST